LAATRNGNARRARIVLANGFRGKLSRVEPVELVGTLGKTGRSKRPAPPSAGRSPLAAALPRRRSRGEHQEAALAASSLVALPGVGYLEAAQTLKAMAEKATRRRRESGVA
jgi:hypothetical protein